MTATFNDFIVTPGINFVQVAGNAIQDAAESLYQGVRTVEGFWDERNAEIKDWTDQHLPKPIAKVAQAFVYALPVILLYLATPSFVFYPIYGTYACFKIAQIIRSDTNSNDAQKMTANGFGFGYVMLGTYQIGLGIITQNPVTAVFGGIKLVFASMSFARSGLLRDTYNSLWPEAESNESIIVPVEVIPDNNQTATKEKLN